MREYIKNLTDNLIGSNNFDKLLEREVVFSRGTLLELIQINLLGRDVRDMNPATLGKIMCSLEIGDVMASHLGKEVGFSGDCEEMLRELVSRALAYVILDRLDPVQLSSVPPYTRKKQDASSWNKVSTGAVKGFVFRHKATGPWEVLVEDPSCEEYDGEIFEVEPGATVISELGVYVTFRVEAVQVGEQKILKAVDVRLLPTA